MTTPTLHEILQRLREETQFRSYHITRARLLAVCDALEHIVYKLEHCGIEKMLWAEERLKEIETNLAAALKL